MSGDMPVARPCPVEGASDPIGCGRCMIPLTLDTAEYCWYCMDYLCRACWDALGHCGHPLADFATLQARMPTPRAGRRSRPSRPVSP